MRPLVCLFALYILILGCIPCRADDDCCIEETIVNAHSPSNKAEPAPAYPRPCSPFFACGASHMFVIPELAIDLPKSQPIKPIQQAIYKAATLPDFPSSIWQPPKTA